MNPGFQPPPDYPQREVEAASPPDAKQAPQIAYEAYCELLEGFYIPTPIAWGELAPILRQAWAAVVEAVEERARREGGLL